MGRKIYLSFDEEVQNGQTLYTTHSEQSKRSTVGSKVVFTALIPTNHMFHEKLRERTAAHIVQIQLCFRDQLLNILREAQEKEEFISKQDR